VTTNSETIATTPDADPKDVEERSTAGVLSSSSLYLQDLTPNASRLWRRYSVVTMAKLEMMVAGKMSRQGGMHICAVKGLVKTCIASITGRSRTIAAEIVTPEEAGRMYIVPLEDMRVHRRQTDLIMRLIGGLLRRPCQRLSVGIILWRLYLHRCRQIIMMVGFYFNGLLVNF